MATKTAAAVPLVIAGPLLPTGSELFRATGSASAAAAAAIEADPIPCTPAIGAPPIDAGAVDDIVDALTAIGPVTPPARTLFTSSPRMPKLAGAALG